MGKHISKISISILLGLFLLCCYLFFYREFEVHKLGDRTDIRLFKNALSGNVRITDADAGQTIFLYNDESGIVLEEVQKRPDGTWEVTLRDHNRTGQSND